MKTQLDIHPTPTATRPAPPTLGPFLRQLTARLAGLELDQPARLVELLASHYLACPRLELYNRYREPLTPEVCRRLEHGIARLATGEPWQYILGEAEFMGRRFAVDNRVLIPRPETELLVEWMLACAPLWQISRPTIIDVGTGSGCIVIMLALLRPHGQYCAGDLDAPILDLARQNAARHGVADQVQFRESRLLAALMTECADALVANLPYVPTAEINRLAPTVRDFEPRAALDGGRDGLELIRALIPQAAVALKPGGRLFLEIGDRQGAAAQALLAQSGFREIRLRPDLAGQDRLVKAQKPDK